TGIYSYSKAGFGSYTGFTIGWSYWLCQVCGNVGYAVITMDALNYFFPPYFAGGNNLASIIGGSIIIWFFNFLVLRGIKQDFCQVVESVVAGCCVQSQDAFKSGSVSFPIEDSLFFGEEGEVLMRHDS
ncbi:MAG: amino acid permease, partial [Bacteroidaceae bacterium]|nr:amino acid permease [Bacteroidaceae bacterium]